MKCFTKFQTLKNPLGAGHRRSQPAPVTHAGPLTQAGGARGNRFQKELQATAAGNRGPRKEQQQRDPKRDLRRRAEGAPEQGSFPDRSGETPTGAETPLKPREEESGAKESKEDWGGVVVGRMF